MGRGNSREGGGVTQQGSACKVTGQGGKGLAHLQACSTACSTRDSSGRHARSSAAPTPVTPCSLTLRTGNSKERTKECLASSDWLIPHGSPPLPYLFPYRLPYCMPVAPRHVRFTVCRFPSGSRDVQRGGAAGAAAGDAASLTPYKSDTPRPSLRTNRTRRRARVTSRRARRRACTRSRRRAAPRRARHARR